MQRNQVEAEYHKEDGNRLYHHGWCDQAVRCYTQAIQCDPENPAYYANRAMALLRCRRPQDALADADTVVKMNPQWSKGHLRRGQALMQLQQHDEARKSFEAAWQLTPDAAERQEIERLVAKCDSRLAVAAAQMTSRPPATSTSEGAGMDIAAALGEMQAELEEAAPLRERLVRLSEVVQAAVMLQQLQQRTGNVGMGLPSICEEAMSKAFDGVMVAQAQLLDAAKGDKADVFQGALQTRDQAVEALRQYVTESASAVGAVQDLERFMETNDDGAVYALLGQEKASALASALNTTVEAIPTKMRAAIARTNTAMKNLRECLRMEKQLANELGIDEVIRSAVATFENAKLEVTKDNALAKLHSDVEKAQKELSQVTAKLEPFSTFLDRFTGAKSDICRLQQEHDELEARRLSLERRRITLQADAEWKEVTGVAAEEIAQDREVVQQLREQLQVVKTKQSEINAALETLATVRPEMNWKGPVTAVPSTKVPATSAQDKELLQRLVAALSRGRGDFAGENNGKPYIVLTR